MESPELYSKEWFRAMIYEALKKRAVPREAFNNYLKNRRKGRRLDEMSKRDLKLTYHWVKRYTIPGQTNLFGGIAP